MHTLPHRHLFTALFLPAFLPLSTTFIFHICRRSPCGMQDGMQDLRTSANIDVLDPSLAFL